MNNIKTLNYPGVLRAFNKIEESPDVENKIEVLSALSTLIDKAIQKELEQIRYQYKTVSKNITVTEDEIQELLIKLKESDIVLYESISNEQALIVNKNHCFSINKGSDKRFKRKGVSRKKTKRKNNFQP